MASRKDQKEQARAARIAKEQQSAATKQRTRRIQIFGGVIAIAVIVIVVAIVVSSGGGGGPKGAHPGLETGKQERQLVSSVNTLLKGIPQSGTTLGDPSAKVTMQYFGDLECPICQEFTLDVFPQFVQDQVRKGNVKVQYRSMCTATCDGKMSEQAENTIFNGQQIAAYAAGSQNLFWQYAELFYHQQKTEGTGYPTDAFLTGIAKQIPGLKLATWQTDRTDPALLSTVNADQKYATSAALPGTPSLIMKGPKGEELVDNGNFPTYSDLAAAVKAVS
ncbi:MAG TPA: thioredoxin domain-containing protein [Solirubrobacteraceae bacterium]|jgi:protein-disulfide isomerase|nr:thioredoxin domain-containing protein [Solirubrobacteraceae bacterium]